MSLRVLPSVPDWDTSSVWEIGTLLMTALGRSIWHSWSLFFRFIISCVHDRVSFSVYLLLQIHISSLSPLFDCRVLAMCLSSVTYFLCQSPWSWFTSLSNTIEFSFSLSFSAISTRPHAWSTISLTLDWAPLCEITTSCEAVWRDYVWAPSVTPQESDYCLT